MAQYKIRAATDQRNVKIVHRGRRGERERTSPTFEVLLVGLAPSILRGTVVENAFKKREPDDVQATAGSSEVTPAGRLITMGGKGEGRLVDLSLWGCRIEGVSPGSSGSRLRLQLWLPDQAHPVKIGLAAVRWVKHDQFGVSFLQVSPDARVRLAQVCQSLHEAQQQPEARVIQVSPSTTVGVLGS